MIKTAAELTEKPRQYANPAVKIRRMVDAEKLMPIFKRLMPEHYHTSAIDGLF